MKPLAPPDTLYIQAAQGGLESGNPIEADAELDHITSSLLAHSDALKVNWEIYATSHRGRNFQPS